MICAKDKEANSFYKKLFEERKVRIFFLFCFLSSFSCFSFLFFSFLFFSFLTFSSFSPFFSTIF